MRAAAFVEPQPFRFDHDTHTYINHLGEERPHITGMLLRCGEIDDTWFTEESCVRGTAVHDLTLMYDQGALDVAECVSPYKGYLLAHVDATRALRPTWHHVEEAFMHPTLGFGGRPDRAGIVWKRRTVLDGKSGPAAKSHQLQTALQAILMAAQQPGILPEQYQRLALYWQKNGKYKIVEHVSLRDFDRAREIIRTCCS